MSDRLGDSLLYVIGGCLLLIFVLTGCLGDKPAITQTGNDNVGQQLGQIKADIGEVKASVSGNRVVAKAALSDVRRFNDARAKQLTQIENSGTKGWEVALYLLIVGLLLRIDDILRLIVAPIRWVKNGVKTAMGEKIIRRLKS